MSISIFSTEIIDNSSIYLFWEGDYDTVMVEKSQNSTTYTTLASDYAGSSYSLWGLTPNTLYYFRITPYDSTGTAGTTYSVFASTPFSTVINTFYAGTSTTTSIPLYWTGSFYKVVIYYKQSIESSYVVLATVAGASSYTASSLKTDTSYDFYIVPYNLNDESATASSVVTASTDYVSKINNISLGTITTSTIDLSWNGEFSFVKVQRSSDGGSNYATDTALIVYDTSDSTISSSGSCSITDLDPYTTYYFRIIPYSENYNAGTTSTAISGITSMGISSFSYTAIGVNYVTLTWTGVYTKLKIYKTRNNTTVTSATITSSVATGTVVTESYTVSNLSSNATYDFYLRPYNGDTATTDTDTITILTDFSAQVNAVVTTSGVTSTSIPIKFDTTGVTSPYYVSALIEQSDNSGATYYDVSLITQRTSTTSPYTYSVSGLTPNTEYYYRVTPISTYGVSGSITYVSTATDGYVTSNTAYLYLDGSNQVVVDCSGLFSYVGIHYASDSSFSSYTEILASADELPYTISSTSVAAASDLYYFRMVPYNVIDVSGSTSNTLYNPIITYFYISDVETSSITLTWAGKYDKITIQSADYDSSTDAAGTYSDVASYVKITTGAAAGGGSATLDYTNDTAKYYRIVPYYTSTAASGGAGADISGVISMEIYVPIITDFYMNVNSQYDICLNWTGEYEYVAISYTVNDSSGGVGSTYYDLCANFPAVSGATGGEWRITQSVFSAMDLSVNSYIFRVTPYSDGDSATTTGAYSSIYNAIAFLDASNECVLASSNINTIVVFIDGYYNEGELYYREDGADYGTDYIDIAASDVSYVSVGGLYTNTTYYFKMVPYNANRNDTGLTSQEIAETTRSMLTYMNFAYDVSNSDANSVYFTWTNVNYDYVDVYDSTSNFLERFYSTDDVVHYDSSGIENLSADTSYNYILKIYDTVGSEETTELTTYTYASTTDLNLSYSSYLTGVTFSWTSTGYTTISVQNTTMDTSAISYSAADKGYYDSYDSESGAYFMPNTQYSYLFSVTNSQGVLSTRTDTITTSAEAAFSVLSTDVSAVTIRVHGIYSGLKVYVGDSSTDLGNTVIQNGIFSATALPISMLYFYPFNTDIYDYSTGIAVDNATATNEAYVSTTDSAVGSASLYLTASSTQYLTLTAVSNSATSAMTFACWFKSDYSDAGARIFDFTSTDGETRFYCTVNDSDQGGIVTIYYTYVDSTETTQFTALDLDNYNTNTWTHLAVVFDSTAATWSAYVNGSYNSTVSSAYYPALTTSFTNYIGRSSTTTDSYYNGYIEDFRIYSTALSASDIATLYQMGVYDITLNSSNSLVSASGTTYYIKIAAANGDGTYSTATDVQSATTTATTT